MRRLRTVALAVLVALVLATLASACGGGSEEAADGDATSDAGGSAATAPRDTSTLAKALIGHWSDEWTDQYYDGATWTTVYKNGDSARELAYEVTKEEPDKLRITFDNWEAAEGRATSTMVMIYSFEDQTYTKLKAEGWDYWEVYVDGAAAP
jgi:hypothetical protein